MVMMIKRNGRLLFEMVLVFAVFGTTAYSQTNSPFFLGQTVPYPALSPDQKTAPSAEKKTLLRQPEFDGPFYDYNYYYYNQKEHNALGIVEPPSKYSGPSTKVADSKSPPVPKPVDNAPTNNINAENSSSTSNPNKKVYVKDQIRSYARNYWTGDAPEYWKPALLPNMIGDNTVHPARILSYNMPDNLSGLTETMPIPLTPTMNVTSLNVAENFNAEVENRFYADLRMFDGGQSYGVTENRNALTSAKKDTSRLTLGFEKKIGYRHSIELRLPIILVGLKSEQNIVGITEPELTTEFGNFSLIYKKVTYRTPEVTVCWGIGLNAPTSPDVKLTYQPGQGRDAIRGTIKNDKVSFVPYIGLQWDREQSQTFGHLLGQLDITVGKDRLQFTDHRYGLTNYEVKLTEPSLFRFHLGAGRWFFHHAEDPSLLRIGGMLEVHSTSNINSLNSKTIRSNTKASGNYFSATATKHHWIAINLVGGIPIQTRRAIIQPFIAIPLTEVRYFNCEGGISADVRF
jgi:hypothetical protein